MKILIFTLFIQFSVIANICVDLKLPESEDYSYNSNIIIQAKDGVKIYGNLLTPKSKEKLPTIIFPNSWTVEEHEYMVQAIRLAKEGFQVFSYSTRGWGCSEGYINVGGKKDLSDLSTIIDWLDENTPAQKFNYGMAGISYGGGLSLLGLASETRVKTVFAMSAWADLKETLFGQRTPRIFWVNLLVNTGKLLGNIDPLIPRILDDVLDGNEDGFIDWQQNRSATNNVFKINLLKKPVYIANNFGDNLFQPNPLIKFFNKIRAPKVLDLSQGSHATAEVPGLLGLQNYVFNKMSSWFRYWLMKDSSAKDFVLNHIVVQPETNGEREVQPKFQLPKKFFLHPRGILKGSLSTWPYIQEDESNAFYAGLDSGATTGIPFISAVMDAHLNIASINYFRINNLVNSLKFKSQKFATPYKLRGIPRLTLNVEASVDNYQIMAYLYDVSPTGIAKLITHGAYTGQQAKERIEMELVATAYNIPKGHSLAIVLDTEDPLYAQMAPKYYRVKLNFNLSQQSFLEVKGWK